MVLAEPPVLSPSSAGIVLCVVLKQIVDPPVDVVQDLSDPIETGGATIMLPTRGIAGPLRSLDASMTVRYAAYLICIHHLTARLRASTPPDDGIGRDEYTRIIRPNPVFGRYSH